MGLRLSMESAIEVLGDSESVEARWLGSALQEARRAAQERPLAIQVEECQVFIQRSRNRLTPMEQERAAEQKDLDAAQVRLTRLREDMMRPSSPRPTQPAATPVPDPTLAEVHQLRARVAEMEAEREEFRKKRARSLSVPSPDMPGASEQSVALFQHPVAGLSQEVRTVTALWLEDVPLVSVSVQRREIHWCKVWFARSTRRRGVASRSATFAYIVGQ